MLLVTGFQTGFARGVCLDYQCILTKQLIHDARDVVKLANEVADERLGGIWETLPETRETSRNHEGVIGAREKTSVVMVMINVLCRQSDADARLHSGDLLSTHLFLFGNPCFYGFFDSSR
jgi:hypothetical protein